MIWGANEYATSLILNINKSLKVIKVIDSKAMDKPSKFQGIDVSPIRSISKNELEKVGALILATDKHQESMKNELFNISPNFLEKIIEF